jgi:prepilin-type N-terminal cleavage/methylation domain-containing protein
MAGHDKGFSLVELMVVVLVIGILVAIAIPVYQTMSVRASQRACYTNQRIIEGAVQQWSAQRDGDIVGLEGVVDGSHPLIDTHILRKPPRCPAAPEPDDAMTVDVAHGAFELDDAGNVAACTHGHGSYRE